MSQVVANPTAGAAEPRRFVAAAGRLRDDLRWAGRTRAEAKDKLQATDNTLALLLREAIKHPEVTMTEAAKLAGIGRTYAYKLISELD